MFGVRRSLRTVFDAHAKHSVDVRLQERVQPTLRGVAARRSRCVCSRFRTTLAWA